MVSSYKARSEESYHQIGYQQKTMPMERKTALPAKNTAPAYFSIEGIFVPYRVIDGYEIEARLRDMLERVVAGVMAMTRRRDCQKFQKTGDEHLLKKPIPSI